MKQSCTIIIFVFLSSVSFAQNSNDNSVAGKNVFGIKLQNQEGDTVTLEEFRGKYLYVDIWFSQCKPCIEQVPFAKHLKSEMENENVAFINISVDASTVRWKECIEKFAITGINLHAKKFTSSYNLLREEFGVSVFPRYWIVSPEGEMLNANAERPSYYLENLQLFKSELDDSH